MEEFGEKQSKKTDQFEVNWIFLKNDTFSQMFRSKLFKIWEEFDQSSHIKVVALKFLKNFVIGENLSTVQNYGERLSWKIDKKSPFTETDW